LEFVEAPPKIHPETPADTQKISNRDALNQSRVPSAEVNRQTPPKALMPGLSDQLAQRENKNAQTPLPALKPQAKIEPMETESNEKKIIKEASMAEVPSEDMKKIEENRQAQELKSEVKPRPEVRGLTGRDKITTQEMSKAKSAGAKLEGLTSFEATGSGMGEYMKNLKERVWLAWFPYLAFQYPTDFKGADAIISFTIDKTGEVKIVKVLESEGSPVFASFCMEAVQRASGFGPLPQELLAIIGKDELEIRFGFHYR